MKSIALRNEIAKVNEIDTNGVEGTVIINAIPTIYDVASLAKVSIATVSRVVNQSDRVGRNSTLKVLWAMEQLNWTPNQNAVATARLRAE